MQEESAILQRLSGDHLSLDRYLLSARETLTDLVARPSLLNRVTLERKPGSLTRNLICGNERMSVWAMVWSPGATTPIHDHHCSCCFAVLTGALREVLFDAIDADRAVKTAEHDRLPGFVAAMMPDGPNIHQMMNVGAKEAISIHIYGYDHRVHDTSIDRRYQPVNN